jgi:hypothetical protein
MIDLSLNLAEIFKKYFQGARNVSYCHVLSPLFIYISFVIKCLAWPDPRRLILIEAIYFLDMKKSP